MPLSFPQEFVNWICTCSLSLRRCSIRFLDDWWTRFIGSQLLYAQRDNWITLWGNWLLCYGMHHGKLSNLPGAWNPPLNWDQISCYSDEKFDDCVSLQEMTLSSLPHVVHSDWKHHDQGYNEGSGSSVIWRSNKAYWPRGRDFQTLWSIMAFVRRNYSSLCWVLVNWIPEEKHSQSIFGSFRVIMIFIVFISP